MAGVRVAVWLETGNASLRGDVITPIRDRRAAYAMNTAAVRDIIRDGTLRARIVTQETLDSVKSALGLFSL